MVLTLTVIISMCLRGRGGHPRQNVVSIEHGDFFRYDWAGKSSDVDGTACFGELAMGDQHRPE